ncbi:hypothetical protein KIPB_006729 [Kipferlia bialata]|uniref:Uncharacterized protein n=1 Tax=Kipferlia bialata TaxID=797122 RepID=A0A9K3GK08_9EUKA|nr:hypothetical protein KIPB_006729 [Kipferlia bialata]|eukprot:g6729.t1
MRAPGLPAFYTGVSLDDSPRVEGMAYYPDYISLWDDSTLPGDHSSVEYAIQDSIPIDSDDTVYLTEKHYTQMSAALEGLEEVTLHTVHAAMSTWPVRDVYTQWLATSSASSSLVSSLQKCTNVYDGFNKDTAEVVGCEDPAPPPNWTVVLIGVGLIVLICVAWWYGRRQAREADRRYKMLADKPTTPTADTGDTAAI